MEIFNGLVKLSVIIPAYNEENRIGSTLESLNSYLSKQTYAYEIIVVIDGAKDKTLQVAKAFSGKVKNLKFLYNSQNQGKGFVVRQGMLAAVGEARLFMDADSSTSIEQIENFWPFLNQGYDIVIASIQVPGAQVNEQAQWYRRLAGQMVKYVIRAVLGLWDIHDTQRGFKLFTAKAAQDIFSKCQVNRFGFDFEVLSLAKHKGYKIKELPVIWNNAGQSTVNLKSYITTFQELLKVRWNLWAGRYK